MNHLAHFHLSFEEPDLVVGNWVADFIQHPDVANYSAGIQRGIYLHRKIDSFSDAHPLMLESATRLRPFLGKYAKVFVDIFNDHLLAISWADWSNDSLPDFSKKTYKILENRAGELPEDLRGRTEKMIAADWLTGYETIDGMRFVLEKFKQRMAKNPYFLKASPDLDGAFGYFLKEKGMFLGDFYPFYADLKTTAINFKTSETIIK